MAYTSDLRGKNLLTDIDFFVRNELKKEKISCNLEFRVFDESKEDAILWEDGGLCFKDPYTGMNLGSNDAGWFLDSQPIFIVEATFGTERGQFGDGQLNRVSHPLGPALNGVYGILMVPFQGFSYVDKKSMPDLSSDNIGYQMCHLKKDIPYLAARISRQNTGKYLIMDPYRPELISNLLLAIIKDKLDLANDLLDRTESIIENMENYVGDFEPDKKSSQRLTTIHFTDGSVCTDVARFYTHNIESLTTSQKRDGHGLFGKALIEIHLAREKHIAIFIRLSNDDINVLKERRSKEFNYIYNNPKTDVYCFDDLLFEDEDSREALFRIRGQNLHNDTEKNLWKRIQDEFNNGMIKVKKHL